MTPGNMDISPSSDAHFDAALPLRQLHKGASAISGRLLMSALGQKMG